MAKHSAQSLKDKALRDLSAKKLPQALKKAQLGVKSFPGDGAFHAIAGFVLTEMDRHKQAIPHFAEAMRHAPDDPQYAENLANALMQTGQLDRALMLAEQKLSRFPESKELARVVQEIETKASNWRDIIENTTRRLAADPDNAQLLYLRARAYSEIDYVSQATADITRAYELQPDDAQIAVRKATDLVAVGDTAASVDILWRVVEQDADNALALIMLVTLVEKDRLGDVNVRIEAARAGGRLASVLLGFAKAHLIDRRDGLAAAMPAYADANSRQMDLDPYEIAEAGRKFENMRSAFDKACHVPNVPPDQGAVPLFVIGQPRSGTTLMEVMLSALPQVEGCGELMLGADLSGPLIDRGRAPDAADASQIARDYRRLMPPLPDGTRAFVDKMPQNYEHLGVLLAAFPNARVINMLRDPRDVGLSMWVKRFTAYGMRYASDQSAIAAVANLYRKYMAHWQGLFGDRILTVAYEDLVAEPERESRRVAEHCGLVWSEQMVQPQVSTQQVRTASALQVRRKISASSVGKWREVAPHLREMLDGFDPVLWPEYDLADKG